MWRLNVHLTQIEECIRTSLFAVDSAPRNPELQRGDPLLLQLTKDDADLTGKLASRIEFALIFERLVPDDHGARSRLHWPAAGKTWRYIVECSETIPTVPFSLEDLPLSRSYAGVGNPQYIELSDQAIIRPYLKAADQPMLLSSMSSVHDVLTTIRNYDKVVRLGPAPTTHVREHDRRLPDTWLVDTLKVLYDHRCQVCTTEFKQRYGVPYANVHRLTSGPANRQPSTDLVVVCPNHAAIIPAAKATFDSAALAFRFPNGLVERLLLRDHLL